MNHITIALIITTITDRDHGIDIPPFSEHSKSSGAIRCFLIV
jgi:hypothetical protein